MHGQDTYPSKSHPARRNLPTVSLRIALSFFYDLSPAEVPLYRRALELGEVFISLISRRDWDGTLCAPGTNHTNRGIEDFGGSDDGCFFSFIRKTRRILEYMGISGKKKETKYKMFHRESCWY